MRTLRAFFDQNLPTPHDVVHLAEDESRHLIRVMRVRRGETVELLDGAGHRIWAHYMGEQGRQANLSVKSVEAIALPEPSLTLLQALPKGKTFDNIVRQATEIGVARILPMLTEHSEVRLAPQRRESKEQHWQAIAREACKQSGNPWLPEITSPASLPEILSSLPEGATRLVASLEAGSTPLAPTLSGLTGAQLCLAVGPEGDFSASEYHTLAAKGFKPVALGSHVLRSDTAALYLLSVADACVRLSSGPGTLPAGPLG